MPYFALSVSLALSRSKSLGGTETVAITGLCRRHLPSQFDKGVGRSASPQGDASVLLRPNLVPHGHAYCDGPQRSLPVSPYPRRGSKLAIW